MAVNRKKPIRAALLFGTRPEAVKLAPILKRLQAEPDRFRPLAIVTAQHRDMLDQVLQAFHINPDMDLNLMQPRQTLAGSTAVILQACEKILRQVRPDLVLVQGDTTTTLAAGLAAFYQGIPVGHVEAGLRTHDLGNPFPEELNRRLVTTMAAWHFSATALARKNLLAEGVDPRHIFVTGNPVVDALKSVLKQAYDFSGSGIKFAPRQARLVMVTAHRRENFGQPLAEICLAVRVLAGKFPDVQFVFPVHRNPQVRKRVLAGFRGAGSNVHCLPPLPYPLFIHLLAGSDLALTDSGGIQEEAPVLGVPVLILRKVTERPEALAAGARLVGLQAAAIVRAATAILRQPSARRKISCPFGDGQAAERIAQAIAWIFGRARQRPREFQG